MARQLKNSCHAISKNYLLQLITRQPPHGDFLTSRKYENSHNSALFAPTTRILPHLLFPELARGNVSPRWGHSGSSITICAHFPPDEPRTLPHPPSHRTERRIQLMIHGGILWRMEY
jgi:hypothetical protein